jgi:hypothetical protein
MGLEASGKFLLSCKLDGMLLDQRSAEAEEEKSIEEKSAYFYYFN